MLTLIQDILTEGRHDWERQECAKGFDPQRVAAFGNGNNDRVLLTTPFPARRCKNAFWETGSCVQGFITPRIGNNDCRIRAQTNRQENVKKTLTKAQQTSKILIF